jgi:hypothetical protein
MCEGLVHDDGMPTQTVGTLDLGRNGTGSLLKVTNFERWPYSLAIAMLRRGYEQLHPCINSKCPRRMS